MSAVPFFDLSEQYQSIRDDIRAAVDRVLDSQRCIGGPEVEALESELEDFLGAPHAIACSNGSDALLLAFMALGIGPGDEVIVPAFTFFATAGSVALAGARPVFVDIDPDTFLIDPAAAAAAITERTRAIVAVDLFGQAAPIDAIAALARPRGLAVVEDAAQAIGAARGGRKVGALEADLTTFSFYPTKNLGACGEGGLITCADSELAARLMQLRNHGQSGVYEHASIGMNGRLDALQAAILRVKLRHLEAWAAARERWAAIYRDALAGAALTLPAIAAGNDRHVYNQFVVRLARREEVRAALDERGVGCNVYYPTPLHTQPCFSRFEPPADGALPRAEQACREVLALPIFPELGAERARRAAAVLAELCAEPGARESATAPSTPC